jgi:hypothetical protein
VCSQGRREAGFSLHGATTAALVDHSGGELGLRGVHLDAGEVISATTLVSTTSFTSGQEPATRKA